MRRLLPAVTLALQLAGPNALHAPGPDPVALAQAGHEGQDGLVPPLFWRVVRPRARRRRPLDPPAVLVHLVAPLPSPSPSCSSSPRSSPSSPPLPDVLYHSTYTHTLYQRTSQRSPRPHFGACQ